MMKHEVTAKGDTAIIALKGEIDLESSPVARELLLSNVAGKKNILVDLSAVSYIDSSGVASLVEALQASRKNGTEFALAAASEAARRVLELARLDKVFTMYNTIDDGLNA
jgi:anti-sigma B factor antagonist